MSEYLSKSLLSTYHIITNITTTLIQTWDLQHRWLACLGSAVLSVIHQLTRSLMCVNRLQERHNHLRLHLVVILSSHGGDLTECELGWAISLPFLSYTEKVHDYSTMHVAYGEVHWPYDLWHHGFPMLFSHVWCCSDVKYISFPLNAI